MLLIQGFQKDWSILFKNKEIKKVDKCNGERWAMRGDYSNFYIGGQTVNKVNIVKKLSLKCMQWWYILPRKKNVATVYDS